MIPRILRTLCVQMVAILLVAPSAQGQTGSKADSVPAIDKLKTPQSPAFVILGLSPANIVHPTTPASVATSLMSSLNSAPGGQPLLPKQFGLEVAPFWLAGHPTLTLTRLEAQTTLGGTMGHVLSALWANAVQTLTVGVAASDSAFKTAGPSPADTSVFRLGFSVRASPIRGRWVAGCVDSLEAVLARLSSQVGARVAAAIAADPTLAGDSARLEKVNQKALAASRAEADSTLRSSQGNCLSVRRGLSVDLAVAGIGRFAQQTMEAGRIGGYAGWATLNYDWDNVSALGVARLGKAGRGASLLNQSYTDLGARLIGKWSDYALSAEAVNRATRQSGTSGHSWRLDVGFDVKVSSTLWLNTSFGRDFLAGTSHPLLAMANLQWNFGQPDIQAPSKGIPGGRP